MIKYIFSIIAICFTLIANAQGSIEYVKDPRIDALIKKQGETTSSSGNTQIPGYRVQLFFDSEKSKVDEMRSSFSRSYPKVEAYVTYNAPNYFLRVGDFRTSAEAERFKSEVGNRFSTSFIVKDRINLPRID